MQTERNSPEAIHVGSRFRQLDEGAVERLVESIRSIGLQTPVSIRYAPDDDGDPRPVLVAGRHRLEACRRLGIDFIECVIHSDETEARLWEIAENLHRAELTALERDQHVAEWVRLTGEKEVSAQSAPKPKGGRPDGGVRAASRELGIEKEDARRAIKVDGLSPEAKSAARDAGLDNNRTALLHAASKPIEEQAEAIRTYQPRSAVKPAPEPFNDLETEEAWMNAIMRVWNRGSADWREEFTRRVDVVGFDRTSAGRAA